MALTTGIITNIASNLAAGLLLQDAVRLRDLAQGDGTPTPKVQQR